MVRRNSLLLIVTLSVVAFAWMLPGCSSDDDGTGPAGACSVSVANDALGALMNTVRNDIIENADSSFRPDDVDFSAVYALYQSALTANSSCKDAQFGAAFTGLSTFLVDPTLNNLAEKFKNVYDTMSFNPFNPVSALPRLGIHGDYTLQSVPLTPGGFSGIMGDFVGLEKATMSLALVDPSISDIQDNLKLSLLPKVIEARNYILSVLADPSYTFTITAAMQGNPGASEILIDKADFHVFAGCLYSLEAAIYIVISRELDVDSYTADGVNLAMQQSSSFLDLKADGAASMGKAKTAILAGEAQAESAITALLAEIGSGQMNDLIPVYEEDRDDLNQATDSVVFYRTYFDGPKELRLFWDDWSNSTYWEDTVWNVTWNDSTQSYDSTFWYTNWHSEPGTDSLVMMVDVAKFFDAPMDNPKRFIPAYTVSFDGLTFDYVAHLDSHYSVDRYWDAMDSLFGITYPNDAAVFGDHMPDVLDEAFYDKLADIWNHRQFIFGWDDVTKYYDCTPPDIYCYESSRAYNFNHDYRHPHSAYICSNWNANSFAEWTFTRPTLNGLLPGMTSDELKEILMDDGSNWGKSGCTEWHVSY